MVIATPEWLVLLAQEAAEGNRLPEPIRTMALMALLGIVLLGLLIVAITLLGGRWVRRWSEHRPSAGLPPDLILKRPEASLPEQTKDNTNHTGTVGGE